MNTARRRLPPSGLSTCFCEYSCICVRSQCLLELHKCLHYSFTYWLLTKIKLIWDIMPCRCNFFLTFRRITLLSTLGLINSLEPLLGQYDERTRIHRNVCNTANIPEYSSLQPHRCWKLDCHVSHYEQKMLLSELTCICVSLRNDHMNGPISELCIHYYLLEVLTSPVVLLPKKEHSVSGTWFVVETSYFFDYKTSGKVHKPAYSKCSIPSSVRTFQNLCCYTY